MTLDDATSSTDSGPKYWHPQHEHILKGWGESAACYRYLHYKAYVMFKKLSFRFTLPIIILSTITGTANFAQDSFPESARPFVPSAIGALNLGAAILTTVQQFLKVNELMESHRVSYIHYGKLARSIRLELTLPVSERGHDGNSMISICRTEYDRLIEQSPPVPAEIISRFDTKFPEDNSPNGKKYEFNRPEIMTIKPINPYDNVRESIITGNVIDHFRKNTGQLNDPEEIEVAKTLADLASVEVSSPVRRWNRAVSETAVEVVVESENNEDKKE
tara:strand:- start:3495 stop:4319 length:825 start_codon:yes stop_codon:yes gene_type:complete